MVVHIYNPNTRDAKTGKFISFMVTVPHLTGERPYLQKQGKLINNMSSDFPVILHTCALHAYKAHMLENTSTLIHSPHVVDVKEDLHTKTSTKDWRFRDENTGSPCG